MPSQHGGEEREHMEGKKEGEHISLPSWCFLLPFSFLKMFSLPYFPPVLFSESMLAILHLTLVLLVFNSSGLSGPHSSCPVLL